MRKIIEEQLLQVKVADLSNFDEAINTYYIPKYKKPAYDVGNCYIIQISKTIINNPDSVWATNWNNGSCPHDFYLKAYVSKVLGQMIYVDTLAYDMETSKDLTNMWSGWLPVSEITYIKQI